MGFWQGTGPGVWQLQATSWSTANVHRQQLPNEIVYGKPQCEKCHLFAKMSKAKGRARFRHTSDSRRRQRHTERERGMKTSAEVVCGAGKRQTEAAYWAMAAPQAEMSQLGCLAASLPHEALVLALSQTPRAMTIVC